MTNKDIKERTLPKKNLKAIVADLRAHDELDEVKLEKAMVPRDALLKEVKGVTIVGSVVYIPTTIGLDFRGDMLLCGILMYGSLWTLKKIINYGAMLGVYTFTYGIPKAAIIKKLTLINENKNHWLLEAENIQTGELILHKFVMNEKYHSFGMAEQDTITFLFDPKKESYKLFSPRANYKDDENYLRKEK